MIYIYIGLAVAFIILILIIPYLFCGRIRDKFTAVSLPMPIHFDDGEYYDPAFDTHTNFAFWNTQRGTKRGMSYDLRGDVPIGQRHIFPFNMSSTMPIVNKPLWAVS